MSAPQNEVWYSDGFLKDAKKLPKEVQGKLGDLISILQEDAFDPRLHSKPLSVPLQGVFSFRITRDYRVGFEFSGPFKVKLLIVDKRGQIYKRLTRKKL
ncbi:MAG: type II toxin-antitoxin system RelE/ParE family toxin [Patescibacteria group bacterium]